MCTAVNDTDVVPTCYAPGPSVPYYAYSSAPAFARLGLAANDDDSCEGVDTFIGGAARFMFAWDSDLSRVDALSADLRECAAA